MMKMLLSILIIILLMVGCSFQGDIARELTRDPTYANFYVVSNVQSVAIDTMGTVWILNHDSFLSGKITSREILKSHR